MVQTDQTAAAAAVDEDVDSDTECDKDDDGADVVIGRWRDTQHQQLEDFVLSVQKKAMAAETGDWNITKNDDATEAAAAAAVEVMEVVR